MDSQNAVLGAKTCIINPSKSKKVMLNLPKNKTKPWIKILAKSAKESKKKVTFDQIFI